MHNVENYTSDLLVYIAMVFVFALVGFFIVNLAFWILRVCKLFYEKRVWVLVNAVLAILVVVYVVPAVLDVCQSSFFTIENVVKMETDFIANGSSKYILVTDESGKVFTCYDRLIDTKSLETATYPGTVVYAKYSKMMLDYYT